MTQIVIVIIMDIQSLLELITIAKGNLKYLKVVERTHFTPNL